MPSNQLLPLLEEPLLQSDAVLHANIVETLNILRSAIEEKRNHWIIAFSGGKDSSLVASLIVEFLRRGDIKDVRVDIVFSDTLMELPPFAENARLLLEHITKISVENNLPVTTHTGVAPVDQRFWFLVLGKGYPPPHNHFRWCTDRLKIRPSRQVMKHLITDASIVLTGVRFGESGSRDSRMKAAMCSKDDSECGQGVWINGDSVMKIPGLAPIAHWRTCKVWEFLLLADTVWQWPFKSLNTMYGDSPATRFGCWMCTLVKEDKALKSVTRHPEWKELANLTTIRTALLEDGRKAENRIKKPDTDNLGRTSLVFRRKMLDDVLTMQTDLKTVLLSEEEVRAIEAYWDVERNAESPYNSECKFWKWQPET